MQDAAAVGVVDGFRNGPHLGGGSARRREALAQDGCKSEAIDKLHGDEVLSVDFTDVMDGHNVGMLQRRRGLRLPPKAVNAFAAGVSAEQQELYRHRAAQGGLSRAVYDAHSTVRDLCLEHVVSERNVRGGGGR